MSVEKTQEILEQIITSPQLTTQLLSKPPFKFIVDIIKSVIKATGYLKSDFTDDEIKGASEDKNTKVAFLDKLIKILDDGSLKNVKATRIIAGKDAEETNKMLQQLGINATNFNKDEKKKKKKTKKDEKAETKEEEKIVPVKEKSTSKKRSSKKDAHEKEISSGKPEKEKRKSSSSVDKKKKSESKERTKSSDKSESKEKKSSEKAEKAEKSEKPEKTKKSKKEPTDRHLKRQDSMIAVNGDAPNTPTNDNENLHDDGYEEHDIPKPTLLGNMENNSESFVLQPVGSPLKTADSGIESPRMIKPEDRQPPLVRPMTGAAGGRPMTSMGRPGTAASRPAPPKLKKKQIATLEAAPQVVELKSEIISDTIPTLNLEEEDSNFIMENDEEDGEKTARIAELVDEEDRGALVQKIMETKAGIEESATQEQESNTDAVMSIEKEKVKQLQDKLQDLTRSAYPLARIFDFANDDIESMIKELERWRSEQRKNEQDEQNRKASGFGDSSRLYNMISNLQKEISDMTEELSKARGRVLNNEKRILLFTTNI